MTKVAFFVLILSLYGCSGTQEIDRIEVRDREVTVQPPTIRDTVFVTYQDTVVIQGEKVVKRDTILVVKYYPREGKFSVQAKPDSIKIVYKDSLIYQQKIIVKEVPLVERIGYAGVGAIAVLILLLAVTIILRKPF